MVQPPFLPSSNWTGSSGEYRFATRHGLADSQGSSPWPCRDSSASDSVSAAQRFGTGGEACNESSKSARLASTSQSQYPPCSPNHDRTLSFSSCSMWRKSGKPRGVVALLQVRIKVIQESIQLFWRKRHRGNHVSTFGVLPLLKSGLSLLFVHGQGSRHKCDSQPDCSNSMRRWIEPQRPTRRVQRIGRNSEAN